MGVSPFSQVTSDRMTQPQDVSGDSQMGYQGKFLAEKLVKQWKRLPKEVLELPSLEVYKKHVDVAPKDMV